MFAILGSGPVPAQTIVKQVSVSTGVGSSPPPAPKFVDSGTGEYSIHEPIRKIKTRQEPIKPKVDHSTSTAEFSTTHKVNSKKSLSNSTSSSSSPFPNSKRFSEFDRMSSRGTSPPPQTISTQVNTVFGCFKLTDYAICNALFYFCFTLLDL